MSDRWTDRDVADLVADYEIIDELGRGASAVVYHARDRALDRLVAIKVVRPHALAAGSDALERLAREARTIARLAHPNIVTLFAVRQLPSSGGLALVMQLVPGGTLKELLANEGPLDPERAQAILRDVAAALAYAHAQGIVHRDVKPENIFLDAETGQALLADFGIAWSEEHESRLTLTGAAIGTPTYMAPEQVDGATPDARSDLYSLGLVAWEMLTGERPWNGESLFNVILKQKTEDLPPMDVLRPGVIPDRLQYIIERLLQKHPGARWAGADAVLDKLQRWVVPADYPQWHQARRRRREAAQRSASRPTDGPAPSPSKVATVVFRRDAMRPVDDVVPPATAPLAATVPQVLKVAAAARVGPTVIQERPPTWVLDAVPEPIAPTRSLGGLRLLGVAAALVVLPMAVPTVREPLLARARSTMVGLGVVSPNEVSPAARGPGGEPAWRPEASADGSRTDGSAPDSDLGTVDTDPAPSRSRRKVDVGGAARSARQPVRSRAASAGRASAGRASAGRASGEGDTSAADPMGLLSPLAAPRVRGRPLVVPSAVAPALELPRPTTGTRSAGGIVPNDDPPPFGART